jgi:hypothetical protein
VVSASIAVHIILPSQSLKPALGENCENGVMYYLKDAKADFFKMMELVETITF